MGLEFVWPSCSGVRVVTRSFLKSKLAPVRRSSAMTSPKVPGSQREAVALAGGVGTKRLLMVASAARSARSGVDPAVWSSRE